MWKLQSKKIYIFLGVGLILVLLGGFGFLNKPVFADLSINSIHLADLPEDAHLLTDGPVKKTDVSHPLALSPSDKSALNEERASLYQYESAYSFTAFAPDEAVFVANFTYRYRSQSAAAKAAELLINDLKNSRKLIIDIKGNGENELKGQAFTFAGDEGDSVYWFVSVTDKTLFLIMVNGFDDNLANNVFQSVVQSLISRLNS